MLLRIVVRLFLTAFFDGCHRNDVEVVVMRGTAPAVQSLIANSIFAVLLVNDGPIAAGEEGFS